MADPQLVGSPQVFFDVNPLASPEYALSPSAHLQKVILNSWWSFHADDKGTAIRT
jgi:hypothetical protein